MHTTYLVSSAWFVGRWWSMGPRSAAHAQGVAPESYNTRTTTVEAITTSVSLASGSAAASCSEQSLQMCRLRGPRSKASCGESQQVPDLLPASGCVRHRCLGQAALVSNAAVRGVKQRPRCSSLGRSGHNGSCSYGKHRRGLLIDLRATATNFSKSGYRAPYRHAHTPFCSCFGMSKDMRAARSPEPHVDLRDVFVVTFACFLCMTAKDSASPPP